MFFAQYDGHTVSGKAYYSDMTPAAETYMEIWQAGQDTPLLEGKTDHDGQFAILFILLPKVPLK